MMPKRLPPVILVESVYLKSACAGKLKGERSRTTDSATLTALTESFIERGIDCFSGIDEFKFMGGPRLDFRAPAKFCGGKLWGTLCTFSTVGGKKKTPTPRFFHKDVNRLRLCGVPCTRM